MGDSYRIKTELGINKTINVQLDQEFEFLEILSLKLQQSDIYLRECADYGVIVGRITANNGFGIPNARISVFIPITSVDESNPLISSIYPYKSPSDKNEDGYRYNLLPYEKSYSKHAATGTLPTRLDVLTGTTAIEIYDKYYKFTAKTNESGDYMIMGAPLGYQTIMMDVDLSDIGEFSLTPQDLIRMGIATESQVAGNQFRTSNDLNSLPQIISITKSTEISPLWGDPGICDISVNRVDFDLRDDANVDIRPTAVFMGSIYSTLDNFRVRKNCKPRDNMGNLCSLTTSPGQILAIRQTINQDIDGNPVLEQFQLEQAGNIIDGGGTWMTELPMNLDYFVTNQYGEKVISNDPTIGIPTKAKYRFKVKWQQPNNLTLQTRRPYYLVPNVREYGWQTSDNDPIYSVNVSTRNKLASSYYFGLAWSGYTNGFSSNEKLQRLNDCITGEDTFYEFQYNRVYTVSSLIDEFKKGSKSKFIGIKEIDDDSCGGSVNKFPVNDGVRNFDLLFFLFSIIFTLLQPIGVILIFVANILIFLFNLIKDVLCFLCGIKIPIINVRPFAFICNVLNINCNKINFTLRLPMITYPECQACDCKQTAAVVTNFSSNAIPNGVLSYVSSPEYYINAFQLRFSGETDNTDNWSIMYSESVAGLSLTAFKSDPTVYKLPLSESIKMSTGQFYHTSTKDLPLGERINVFNQRKDYFSGKNRMSITFSKKSNIGKSHYDNSITVLSVQQFSAGDLLTFVNISGTTDVNYLYNAKTFEGVTYGISGTSITGTGATKVNISYANPNVASQSDNLTVQYDLPYGSSETNYKFPADIEYYQVITALTVSQAAKIWNVSTSQAFPDIISGSTSVYQWVPSIFGSFRVQNIETLKPSEYYDGFKDQYILVLQRGVDPYSPKYVNEYKLGTIFGTNDSDPNWTFTAETRLNIPIQKLVNPSLSIQPYGNQSDIYYQSYFFKPILQFNTTSTTVYGLGNSPGTLIVNTGLSYVENQYIKIEHNTSNFEYARVKNYNINTGELVFDGITGYTGSGIYNTWVVTLYDGDVENKPGGYFTGFSTTNTAYYGLLSSNTLPQPQRSTINGNQVISQTSNGFYSATPNGANYDSSEDVSGIGMMSCANYNQSSRTPENYKDALNYYYYTKSLFAANPNLYLGSPNLNIVRTDRLPTSDQLDGGSWNNNPAMLQQNNNFGIYLLDTTSGNINSAAFSTGAQQVTPDLEGLPNYTTVLNSFSCENMVGLKCYQGIGESFGINPDCEQNDAIERGCYLFLRNPSIGGAIEDISSFAEWGYRFRFFYGLCRGVLSQTFVNNWVNGSLYMFPIQVDTYYNKQNKPEYPRFCYNLAYFESNTNNFYYRSSPYNENSDKFIGMRTGNSGSVNDVNLLYPTTIINLGMKDSFYSEITFEPSTKGYILPNITSTSYGDTSDLINLFVISRITDEGFLAQIISLGDNSIDQLFSRPQKRIDGDLAQLMSINSEIGNINFSPEFYDTTGGPPTTILGTKNDPIIAVWFSSTTEDLQTKDYLTPGRIDFRGANNVGWYPYPYGIKSQIVPFYQWKLSNTDTIFGNQNNTWATSTSEIIQNTYYQGLDRTSLSTKYFQNQSALSNDLNARGYIFSVDGNGKYIATGAVSSKFLVGAPYQFYFGVVKGDSALDKFKTKYSISE